jgi:hypothetical protein
MRVLIPEKPAFISCAEIVDRIIGPRIGIEAEAADSHRAIDFSVEALVESTRGDEDWAAPVPVVDSEAGPRSHGVKNSGAKIPEPGTLAPL